MVHKQTGDSLRHLLILSYRGPKFNLHLRGGKIGRSGECRIASFLGAGTVVLSEMHYYNIFIQEFPV